MTSWRADSTSQRRYGLYMQNVSTSFLIVRTKGAMPEVNFLLFFWKPTSSAISFAFVGRLLCMRLA